MDLQFSSKSCYMTPHSLREVWVEASDVSVTEILEQFNINDILDHFDKRKLLEEIGVDEAKDYFDLIENNS